ncbi:MAG TPA: response regulator transcription factor [Nocardioidaceae bacterium]|nr:response regulator transcription factor [Nocardioidaceae bacterium]
MSEPAARLRVIVAEDNYLVREGIRRLLEDSGEVEVVADAGDAEELLAAAARLCPDVVVSDIRMPPGHGMEGIVAAHTLRARDPRIGVVILSQHADEAYAFALLEHGTAGLAYLLKDRVSELGELLDAVRSVARDGSTIDPVVVEALVGARARLAHSPLRELTDRETDVLRLMAQGRTNRAIAAHLSLSESAVEKHVSAIFGKLGLAQEPSTDRRVSAVLAYLRDDAGSRTRDLLEG